MATDTNKFDFAAKLGSIGFSSDQLKGLQKILKYFQTQVVTAASITSGTIAGLTSLAVGASGSTITQIRTYNPTLDATSVSANTTAEQTFTVNGLSTSDKVFVNKATHVAGLGIVGCHVPSANTLAIRFANVTGTPIDPASDTYHITAIRITP